VDPAQYCLIRDKRRRERKKNRSAAVARRRRNDQIIITTNVSFSLSLSSRCSSSELSRGGGDAVHNVTATCQGEPPRRNHKCAITVVDIGWVTIDTARGLMIDRDVIIEYVCRWPMNATGKTVQCGRDKNMIGRALNYLIDR